MNDQSTPEQIEMTKLLTETQYINVAATTATAPPVTVHYRDGTKREFHMIDGSLDLGPEHLIARIVVNTITSDDAVISVGTTKD